MHQPGDKPSIVAPAVEWGHILFLAAIATAISWYLYDTLSVSHDINNTLIVVPLSIVALALCVVVLMQCLRRRAPTPKSSDGIADLGASELRSNDLKQLALIGGLATALGGYVFLLNVIGFDIATWLFALAAMAVCGERRPLPLLLYPVITAVVLIMTFRALLPYPMYTTVL